MELTSNKKPAVKKQGMQTRKWKQTLFLIVLLAYPIIQFIVFYIGVNFNSILLSFQKFDSTKGEYYFVGVDNYTQIIKDIFKNGELITEIKNSALQFVLQMFIGMPLHVFVAFCVWKKFPFSGFFKIVLFLPSMVSGTVFALVVKYLLRDGLPLLLNNPDLTIISASTFQGFLTILIYDLWLGFAGGMVVYLGAMSGISEDVVEYGKLENLGTMGEFIHIVVPGIFPTITTYVVAGMAGFFTNYGSYFTFYGGPLPTNIGSTLGYHFFVMLIGSNAPSFGDFPYASASGLAFTVVIAPLTILVKRLMEKYGPSED